MKEIFDRQAADPTALSEGLRRDGPESGLAGELRASLGEALARIGAGRMPLQLPGLPPEIVTRGEGHFHVAPELFVQLSGWTEFRFPHAECRLGPGEALLMPPQLLHAERVGGAGGEAFRNIVIYAAGDSLTCHFAHEAAPGVPGILHLEARRHAQAARVREWMSDAARIVTSGEDEWGRAQRCGLVVAAIGGVLRALDDTSADPRAEPPLVARVRLLVQNQLGDHALSVRRLAQQSGCTADYLSHVFSRATGEHLIAYITRQRVERAAHLLRHTELAGKEVAWACGFATPSYFIRNFRAQFGVTPRAWRASAGERGLV